MLNRTFIPTARRGWSASETCAVTVIVPRSAIRIRIGTFMFAFSIWPSVAVRVTTVPSLGATMRVIFPARAPLVGLRNRVVPEAPGTVTSAGVNTAAAPATGAAVTAKVVMVASSSMNSTFVSAPVPLTFSVAPTRSVSSRAGTYTPWGRFATVRRSPTRAGSAL